MSWSPLNVLLQLMFVGGLALGLAGMVYLHRARNPRLMKRLGVGLALWITVYVGVVLLVSVTSSESTLPVGQAKHFCGFYLDCHPNVAVAAVSRESSDNGTTYRVNLRFGSDARQATLTLYHPGIHLLDEQGRRFDPAPAGRSPTLLSEPIAAGGSYTTEVVFRLPADAGNPRLLVTEMEDVWPDKLLEMLLIGDEDSMFHRTTVLQLQA